MSQRKYLRLPVGPHIPAAYRPDLERLARWVGGCRWLPAEPYLIADDRITPLKTIIAPKPITITDFAMHALDLLVEASADCVDNPRAPVRRLAEEEKKKKADR